MDLFVDGLPPSFNSKNLTDLFAGFGTVLHADVVTNKDGNTLQFGFVLQVLSVTILAIGWNQRWFPFDGPAYEGMADLWPFLALQVIFYAAFLRRPTVGRIWALLLFLSILQGLGVLLMLWRFVGQRAWAP